MRPVPSRFLALLLLAGVSACAQVRSHTGYVVDTDLVNSVQPGVDNKQSVLATLGTPSFTGQFADRDWYYIARESRNLLYKNPHLTSVLTLHVSFDPAGNVTAIRRTGIDQVAEVKPYGKTTPTLGRKRSFFQDLFGNIGTVGAAGTGAGGAGGGGRDTP